MGKKTEQKEFIFVSDLRKTGVEYFVLSEKDGGFKKIPKMKKRENSQELLADGTPVYITRHEFFDVIGNKAETGFASRYVLKFEDTDSHLEKAQKTEILRKLNELAKNENHRIWTLDEWNKRQNRQAWEERNKREELEDQIAEKDTIISELKTRLEKIAGRPSIKQ
jgi:hypothetical protein